MKRIILLSLFILAITIVQAEEPTVSNVTASQRTDGSKIVDIYYDVSDGDGDTLTISLELSDDGGSSWSIIPTDSLLSGDIGDSITVGSSKHIVWEAGSESLSFEGDSYKFKVTAEDGGTGTVTDIDGNVYQTMVIGDQEWMTENLKVTHYRNGDSIPNLTDVDDWTSTSSGAYCYYDNDPSNSDTYGALYNWYAVDDSRGLAPAGWHVPTDDEIKELEMYLGMSQSQADDTDWRGTNEGSKLAGGYDLWSNGDLRNDPEFDTSGFSFLPGGYRFSYSGSFLNVGNYGSFWSSTEGYSSNAWYRHLYYDNSAVYRYNYGKQNGFSVRCVRD